jgi:hypothetical protein
MAQAPEGPTDSLQRELILHSDNLAIYYEISSSTAQCEEENSCHDITDQAS